MQWNQARRAARKILSRESKKGETKAKDETMEKNKFSVTTAITNIKARQFLTSLTQTPNIKGLIIF